ncbi:MAG: hypothetical protein ACJ8LG_23125 [Massilia sp.]
MNNEPANPTRRSALVLHALCRSDREWILQRLPVLKQETLRGLLRELAELGIPSDPELLKPFEATPRATEPGGTAVTGREIGQVRPLCSTVARLEPEHVALVLGDEPSPLIAAFVQLYDWPWRDAFIQHLGPLRRKQVLDLLAADAVKAPLPLERPAHALLLNAIIARVGALPLRATPHDSRPHARGWLGAATRWLRSKGLS